MLIGLCGTYSSGKSLIAEFLVNEFGFTYLNSSTFLNLTSSTNTQRSVSNVANKGYPVPSDKVVAQCWRSNINIVLDNVTPSDINLPDLLKRPYFLLVYVDAPLLTRFQRTKSLHLNEEFSLHSFVEFDDFHRYSRYLSSDQLSIEERDNEKGGANNGNGNGSGMLKNEVENVNYHSERTENSDSPLREFERLSFIQSEVSNYTLRDLERMSHIQIFNDYSTVDEFIKVLHNLNVPEAGRLKLRPSWDIYFMSLATLVSKRTNCMKRHVGCVIVRDRRIVASGYNGTPSGVTNCFDGGCPRCNGILSKGGTLLDLCFCLHAEENAIIEAGRDRCKQSTLYTTLFPCILCAKKIVQSGVSRVVFDDHYSTADTNSEMLLKAGSVIIDKVAS